MFYVVSSPARVGSHYLLSILESTGVNCAKTHNPFFVKTNFENTYLIILNRRERFEAIMSCVVFHRTKQTNRYDDAIDILPFELSHLEFSHCYFDNKFYSQQHDLSQPWKKVEYFYFEDFLNNANHVFERLNLKQRKNQIIYPPKSPYDYRDSVKNWQECKNWFEEYETNPNLQTVIKNDRSLYETGKSPYV